MIIWNLQLTGDYSMIRRFWINVVHYGEGYHA